MITNGPLDWSSEDIANWRSFLLTETGKRLFPKFLESAPPLLGGGPTNEILIRNGEFLGWQNASRALLALSAHEPEIKQENTNSAYPPLDEDKHWNDKQKIDIKD